MIKGEIQGRIAKDPSGMDIDMAPIIAENEKRVARFEKNALEIRKLSESARQANMKDATAREAIKASLKNKVVGEK